MITKNKPGGSVGRQALHQAIATRDDARKKVEVAREREARGRELLREAEVQLASFDDIDATIIKHRAGRFRKAATTGASPDTKLPPDLASRRERRNEASEVCEGAKAAFDSLVSDLAAAEHELHQMTQTVSDRAVEILIAAGVTQAAELRAAWDRIWQLQDALTALSRCWSAQLPPDAVRMTNFVASMDHRQFPGGHNATFAQAVEQWRAWHKALCDDAAFEFDGAASAAIEPRRVIAA